MSILTLSSLYRVLTITRFFYHAKCGTNAFPLCIMRHTPLYKTFKSNLLPHDFFKRLTRRIFCALVMYVMYIFNSFQLMSLCASLWVHCIISDFGGNLAVDVQCLSVFIHSYIRPRANAESNSLYSIFTNEELVYIIFVTFGSILPLHSRYKIHSWSFFFSLVRDKSDLESV